MDALKTKIRHVPDFPKAGILFYDVTTLLRDAEGFKLAIDALATPYVGKGIDLVVGVESRGFILGAAVADRLGAGFVPVRKVGKLPSAEPSAPPTTSNTAATASRCTTTRSRAGQRVLIVDDLLATGGTARATVDLVEAAWRDRSSASAFLIELVELDGRAKLAGETVTAVLEY